MRTTIRFELVVVIVITAQQVLSTALDQRGNSPSSDALIEQETARAVEYLVGIVKTADSEGPRITHLEGTQPQRKL